MFPTRREKRGASILELLMMSTLALLLLFLLMKLLSTVHRSTQRGAEEVALQQSGAVLMNQLVHSLKASTAGQLQLYPDLLALRTLEDSTAEGDQVWSSELVVFSFRSSEAQVLLGRRELTAGELTQRELRFERDDLLSVPGRVVAKNVTSFSIQEGPPIRIEFTLESESGERSLNLSRSVYQALKVR